jgi:hypothetical protein
MSLSAERKEFVRTASQRAPTIEYVLHILGSTVLGGPGAQARIQMFGSQAAAVSGALDLGCDDVGRGPHALSAPHLSSVTCPCCNCLACRQQ